MTSEAQGTAADARAVGNVLQLQLTRGRVRVGSVDVTYDVRGSGEPLLLIPGLSMRRLMWPDELCDALAASGLQVVRMDNRDAGEGTRIAAPPVNVMSVVRRTLLGLPVEVPYQLEDMAGRGKQCHSGRCGFPHHYMVVHSWSDEVSRSEAGAALS